MAHVGEFGQKQLDSTSPTIYSCQKVLTTVDVDASEFIVDHRRKDVQNLTWINGLTR